jgi:hypothetical protein
MLVDVDDLREHRADLLGEGLAGGAGHVLDVARRDVHVGERRRREALVLVAVGDGDVGPGRQLQAGGLGLRVELHLVGADQAVDLEVRLDLLDLVDRRLPLRDAEGEVLVHLHLGAVEAGGDPRPLPDGAAEIVVGADIDQPLAELLDHPLDRGQQLLLRRRAGEEGVVVGDAALALVVVPVDDLVPHHLAPRRLALGAGVAGHDDVGLVVEDAFLGQLLVLLDVGLAVIGDQLDLLLGAVDHDAAGVVDLLHGQLVAVGLRRRHDREVAGQVVDRAQHDAVLGGGGGRSGDERGHGRQRAAQGGEQGRRSPRQA